MGIDVLKGGTQSQTVSCTPGCITVLEIFATAEKGKYFSGSEHPLPAGRHSGGRRRFFWKAAKNSVLSKQPLGCPGVTGPPGPE